MRALGIISRILLAILALALLAAVSGYVVLRSSLPRTSGTIVVPQLAAELRITRDEHGVPHIVAQSLEDAYFGLGFVHAQDRLWQMEFQRRVAAGRLAEVVGAAAVPTDRFIRTLGVYRAAEAAMAWLDPTTIDALQAYANGVNAFLATRSGVLPPEFILFGHEPEPWQPADTIAWAKMMAWDLAGNWDQELLRAELATILTFEQYASLWPAWHEPAPVTIEGSWADIAPAGVGGPGGGFAEDPEEGEAEPDIELPGSGEDQPEQVPGEPDETDEFAPVDPDGLAGALGAFDLGAIAAAFLPRLPPGSGSNAWAISGEHTASGLPLLANDPHLGLQAPSLFYLVHVTAPGLNVIGGSLPGSPAVLLGRNERIAWGLTNTGTDVQDIYIERTVPPVSAQGVGQYLTEEGYVSFQQRTETIRVSGGSDISIVIRETRHGPVISDLTGAADRVADSLGEDGETYVLALRWSALDPDDRTVQAVLNLNRATDWDQFLAALEDFHNPQQNVMYADVDGNIGFVSPGRVPVRTARDGGEIVPGWTGEFSWNGYVPFDELPRILNPASGVIVNANQQVPPDDYPHFITAEWTLPYRANRILELLGRLPMHSVATASRIQGDQVSLMARDLLPHLRAVAPEGPLQARAHALLLDWDGAMSRDAAAPLIVAAWQRELQAILLHDTLGERFGDYAGHRPAFIINAMNGAGGWCDLAAPTVADACGEVARTAFVNAVAWLTQRLGPDPDAWRWGDLHVVDQQHAVLGQTPLAPLANLSIASGGDAFTVNAASFRMFDADAPFSQHRGAAYRAVMDLGDADAGLFVHSTGQSGNPLSPHYRDLQEAWRDNEPLPMVMSPAARANTAALVLVPGR